MPSSRFLPFLPIAAVALALAACPREEPGPTLLPYPETEKVDVVDDYHGTPVPDPYRWLEDTEAPETRAWIEAQNEVTFTHLQGIPFRGEFQQRLTELWNYERYGVPFKEAGRYFYSHNDGLQDHSVLFWKEALGEEPRVLIDPNTFSEDGTVALAATSVSPDGRLIAYGKRDGGSDWQEVFVRDIDTGEDLADHLEWMKFSPLAWTHDGEGFFYSRYPEPEGDPLLAPNFDHKLYYHRLGTDQAEDALVYERPDQREWRFAGVVTDDGRYLVVHVFDGTAPRNRVYYMDLEDPEAPRLDAPMVELLDDLDASYSLVHNDGPVFYFRTDLDAPRYRLIAIDTRRPQRERWTTVIPEADDLLQGVQAVGDVFAARYLHNASSRVRLFDRDGSHRRDLELPTLGSVRGLSGDDGDPEVFYAFTSFLYPTTIFRHDFEAGETEIFREPDLDFDPEAFETHQVWYTSKDGTDVPMFITHRRGVELDGENPTLLFGYGGFNISMTPSFSVSNLAWIERGGVYAVANLRGGGEFGRDWHRAGTKENKQNVFDDFIAAAEYLIAAGYTSSERLGIFGGSNGGLLVGAVLNQRPGLFGAAIPAVGVMDMLRFHEFTVGRGWISDYGDPDDPEMFPVLKAYSPYHNIEDGTEYPPVLVTTADHDDRVVPGHSFKYAARLQEAQAGDAPVIIRIETRAGHGAGMPTHMQIEQAADRWAFLAHHLGLGS